MKYVFKIFSVFLSLSLILALSYCCCIQDAMAKQSRSCCGKTTTEKSHSCNSQNHICPKFESSFGEQALDAKKSNFPQLTFFPEGQMVQNDGIQPPIIIASKQSSEESFKIPLYIAFHNFRI